MSTATDILGKIGEKVGTEIKTVSDAVNQASGDLTSHINDATNPHGVTKAQVGLGNVEDAALSTFAGSTNITTLGTISTGAVPYSLVTGAPNPNQIDGDLNITGNLQVNGTRTILQTQTLQVEDNFIELNLQSDGTETAQTAGVQINRGSQSTSNVTNYDNSTDWSFGAELSGGYTNDEEPRTIETNGDSTAIWPSFLKYDSSTQEALTIKFKANNDIELKLDKQATNEITSQIIGTWSSTGFVMASGWSITNASIQNNHNYLTQNGGQTVGNVVLDFDLTYTESSTTEDKAKIIWDDTTSKFRLKVGNAAADLVVDKIYNNNMFAAIGDLPSATQYHGMMAQVHATGQSYFAHGGNWVELISVSGGQTISGNLTATGSVTADSFAAPDKDGFTINGTSLGDYSTFETALTTAMA